MTESKRALVTGASEGIGRALVKRLAAEGYSVTAVARNESRLKELLSELASVKGTGGHSYRVADLSTSEGMEQLAQELKSQPVQLLVNNAGFGFYGEFYRNPLAKYQEMVRLNCEGLMVLSHAFLEGARSGDALINVASTLGFMPMPVNGVYAATKSFVVSFSESLWFEQKKRGIYVAALCPGITESQFHTRSGGNRAELPRLLTESADQVVEVVIQALRSRRKPVLVSGFHNRLMIGMTRLLSRKSLVNSMGKIEQ